MYISHYLKFHSLDDSGTNGSLSIVAEFRHISAPFNKGQLVTTGIQSLETDIDSRRYVPSPVPSLRIYKFARQSSTGINDEQVLSRKQVVGSHHRRKAVHAECLRTLIVVRNGDGSIIVKFKNLEIHFRQLSPYGIAKRDYRCNYATFDGISVTQHGQAVERMIGASQDFNHLVSVKNRKFGNGIADIYY